ncbi:hypothetical protein E3N88_26409 [Mikania micrantha]|uniref:Integrase catalytic domain-containing protein n=1 Tax=Mikania micrantha TaxID=192012 RepID=A0A5N6N966_9ASTR|nr:hypothetical protein E3N88_26409 [Mikania micrantha]
MRLVRFKEWKVLVEKQTERKVKNVRTDNGLEFFCGWFNKFCKDYGIARHLTMPGNPQQNGIVERMNRTLLNKGKLDPRAEKCIFLGYPEGVKRCWVWRLDDKGPKVKVSRDIVKFKENVTYKDIVNSSDEKGKAIDKIEKDCGVQFEVESGRDGNHFGLNDDSLRIIQSSESIAQGRSRRVIVPPVRYRDREDISAFMFNVAEQEAIMEPWTFNEAISSIDKDLWISVMEDEMNSLQKSEIWVLVGMPDNHKLVDHKWIYKLNESTEDLTEAVKGCLWLKRFIFELGIEVSGAVVLCDNQGAVQLSKNQVYHERTKHINVKLHFIKDVVSKESEIKQISTKDNGADMLTKALSGPAFENCLGVLGIGIG